jgi:hypothetical protein
MMIRETTANIILFWTFVDYSAGNEIEWIEVFLIILKE